MNTFWLKLAGFVVLVVGAIFLIRSFSAPKAKPQTNEKSFYDVIAEDDKRLRADINAPQLEEKGSAAAEQLTQAATEEIPLEDRVQAERLFEMALAQRKMGRLPGVSYKLMVDYCREIISKYPNSPQAPKARRMLGEVPRQYWEQYNITEEEVNPAR
jgi:hypothetical protein